MAEAVASEQRPPALRAPRAGERHLTDTQLQWVQSEDLRCKQSEDQGQEHGQRGLLEVSTHQQFSWRLGFEMLGTVPWISNLFRWSEISGPCRLARMTRTQRASYFGPPQRTSRECLDVLIVLNWSDPVPPIFMPSELVGNCRNCFLNFRQKPPAYFNGTQLSPMSFS